MKITEEKELQIPALIVLNMATDLISTATLKKNILNFIILKKDDKVQLKSRKQTIIENKIENLISHKSLEQWVETIKFRNKTYLKITKKGKVYLNKVLSMK